MSSWEEFARELQNSEEFLPPPVETYHLVSREELRRYVEECLRDPRNTRYCEQAVISLLRVGGKLPSFETALDLWWNYIPKPNQPDTTLGPCGGFILQLALNLCQLCQLCLAKERM